MSTTIYEPLEDRTAANAVRELASAALVKIGFTLLRLSTKAAPRNHPASTFLTARCDEVEEVVVECLAPSEPAARMMRFAPAAAVTGVMGSIAFVPSAWFFI